MSVTLSRFRRTKVRTPRRSTASDIRSLLRRRPLAIAALVYVALLVGVAVAAPWLAPRDPNSGDLSKVLHGPDGSYLLGTDELGRDQLSRIIFGARTSMLAALQVVLIGCGVGTGLGLVAGYRGGRIDAVISRVNDAIMSVPALLLAIAVVAIMGPGLTNAMIGVGIIVIPRCYRIVRASTIDVTHRTFIEASVAVGVPERQIILRHVLPNIISPLLVVVTVVLGAAFVAESSLSFLGLGARPPTATWGGMLAAAQRRMDNRYLLYPPALLLTLAVVSCTVLGDFLRDATSARRGRADG